MTRRPRPAEARAGLPVLLTCAEVAEQLQLSQRQVRRLIAAGALPSPSLRRRGADQPRRPRPLHRQHPAQLTVVSAPVLCWQ